LLELGKRGKLKGITYEIVGFIVCQEEESGYEWQEFLLFNPAHGYAFLSETSGHWNYIISTLDYPVIDGNFTEFRIDGLHYDIFTKYHRKIVYAEGEFYWNLIKDRIYVREYISPPYVLIQETSNRELSWYKGEYIETAEIEKAFQLQQVTFPAKKGVGSTQPAKTGYNSDILRKVLALSAVALTVLLIAIKFLLPEETIFEQTFSTTESSPIITKSFILQNNVLGSSNLEVSLYSDVQDDWLETELTFLNEQTGTQYEMDMGVEYYSGYDGGESWSEGSHSTEKLISAMPAGRYRIQVTPLTGKPPHDFRLKVTKNVAMWSNYFILLGVLGLGLLIDYIITSSFEKKRWENSDF
jgi:hypothetical protein